MNKLIKKDIFVQKLKNRPIFVHGKDTTISDEDIALLLACDIIQRFKVRKSNGRFSRSRYRVLHCIHLTHTHLSPAGFWLCGTKIIKPGMWF